jgi:hypothetical protein
VDIRCGKATRDFTNVFRAIKEYSSPKTELLSLHWHSSLKSVLFIRVPSGNYVSVSENFLEFVILTENRHGGKNRVG